MSSTSDAKAGESISNNQISWSGKKAVPISSQDAWDLMWRPGGQSHWLGLQGHIEFKAGTRLALTDETGVWRIAQIKRVKKQEPKSVTMLISASASWYLDHETEVTIDITRQDESGSVITIKESGIPSGRYKEVQCYWNKRLNRLNDLAVRIRNRRKNVRQAVVVIHGIGEQQPGETLKGLINGVFNVNGKRREGQKEWIKPDQYSNSYELHRVTIKGTKDQPTTDIFECYWAHIIRNTTLDQVSAWVWWLLFRWPVPKPIFPWWLLVWILILAVLVAAITALAGVKLVGWAFALPPLVLAVLSWLWHYLGNPLAINFIGDAARYLRLHPANIAHRQAIREAGVSLIEKLHASGRYDRIVLLGHSLGSVIAYDIITHSWARMHKKHDSPMSPHFKEVIAVERELTKQASPNALAFQDVQHTAWYRQRKNTQPWLITDLVTVGSPLTYADFLLADSKTAFEYAKSERILPTCPPEPEREKKSNHEKMTYRSYALTESRKCDDSRLVS
ncbi:SRPBCC domain-containing protein [Stenomitos frigidus]|uniref:Uncharacterized protein n=1 Tax=Stenomitos frigidus ULC18 TaxID=2107698 RepID=A0A2T1E662_9CYAN|nr:SRPBCC domain-containing protein [Stenomitos frigidus]PSB28229.1 hypothetical protein C7B82_14135 [Stenomitos frigidus ULC18]